MAILNTSLAAQAAQPRSYGGVLATVTTLFFMWGFLTSLNDILVPHLKTIFDLNYAQVMLVQFSFFSAYLFFSIPAGKLVDWIGYKHTMVAGLLTMALGAFLFIPAASVPSFSLFLSALMILATGITALQVSANPYVAVLGPQRTSSSRLNLTQAANSLGHTIAPYLGGLLILSAAPRTADEIRQLPAEALHAYRLQQAASVKLPYLGLAIALLLLGVAIYLFRLPPIPEARHALSQPPGLRQSLWRYRHLVLGVVGIFLYVGAEVSIGSFLVNYFGQPEIGNLPAKAAARLVPLYWGLAMVGRFLGSAVMRKVRPPRVLAVSAVIACSLVCLSMLASGPLAMGSILAVGFFNSVMFPTIFTLAIAGLGPLTGDASGVLITAIVGGAVIPEIQGLLADRMGIHHAFIIPALCYLYVLFYAWKGSRPQSAGA
jgi:FHS family L-fucose permease-like MFS transporter